MAHPQPAAVVNSASHLILTVCVEHTLPDSAGDARYFTIEHPIQMKDLPPEGINLRTAAEELNAQIREEGGTHMVTDSGSVVIYPWHKIQWIRISEAQVPQRQPTRRVSIGKQDVMSSAPATQQQPPGNTDPFALSPRPHAALEFSEVKRDQGEFISPMTS